MNKLITALKNNLHIILIVLLDVILFIANYEKGTYFLGWDNLFPEANFQANFQRSIFGIWQEYRGLGLLDGMSFAANLPHYIFIYILSIFLPQNLLRYFFVFLMHVVGGIGIYKLINSLLKGRQHSKTASFIGALFYMFNIGTIQTFYAPYELFLVHYAFLPWLILTSLNLISKINLKNILVFLTVTILSIPQAHVPTIFIVYATSLTIIILYKIVELGRKSIKGALLIVIISLMLNLFWGLPYLYSTINNAQTIKNSKINQMSTEDIYLKNKAFGDIGNVALIKGFMLDYTDIQIGNQQMMGVWKNHMNNPIVVLIGLSFFTLSLIGILNTLIKKNKNAYAFVTLFLITFVILSNNTPIIKTIPNFINNHVPFFEQIFRFTFTKFSTVYFFSFTILASIGIIALFEFLKFNSKKIFTISLILIGCLLTIYTLPSWQGHFLYPSLKVRIPDEYNKTINFLKGKDTNTRIAVLPQPTYWGWTYKSWGYHGSGFIWYGIPQATLDGAFYPWSKENENYYWEMSTALYSQNLPLLESIFEKYQINWVLLDGNEINPPSHKALFIDETKKILESSRKISLEKQFGKISIYKISLDTPVKNFLFQTVNSKTIGSKYSYNNSDNAFYQNLHYINSSSNSDIYYPFASLFTNKSQEQLEFKIEENENNLLFKQKRPSEVKNYILKIPEGNEKELPEVQENQLERQAFLKPEVSIAGDEITVVVPKISGYYSENLQGKDLTIDSACQNLEDDKVSLKSLNGRCTKELVLGNLPHNLSYLIRVDSENKNGKTLLFWLENLNLRKSDIETNLQRNGTNYFIQPPMDRDGLGYSLHFDNISIGQDETINEIGKVSVYPIPYYFLKNLIFQKPQVKNSMQIQSIISTHKYPFLYEIDTKSLNEGSTIILSQAYQSGWKAYNMQIDSNWLFAPLIGQEMPLHELINNWENGWEAKGPVNKNTSKIVIIYLPQMLETTSLIIILIGLSIGLLTIIIKLATKYARK